MDVAMTIKFHDVSHYQGAYVPTGPTIAKATEGATYIDPQYAGIRSRTLAGGWPFLPYHFLRPHTTASIASQVAHVVGVVGHTSIMLDVEKEPLDTLAEQRELRDDVYAFADLYAAAGGLVTLVYFPHWQLQAIGSPSLTGLTSRGIGLVSSRYTTYSDTGPGWDPYGGVTPVIWQYTSTPLDTNAFKGTEPELANLWQNGLNDMALTQADADLVVKTLVADANFQALIWRVQGMTNLLDTVASGPDKGETIDLSVAIKKIPTTAAPAAPVDTAAIAKAVNDDVVKRMTA
jgi:hypothetical protein